MHALRAHRRPSPVGAMRKACAAKAGKGADGAWHADGGQGKGEESRQSVRISCRLKAWRLPAASLPLPRFSSLPPPAPARKSAWSLRTAAAFITPPLPMISRSSGSPPQKKRGGEKSKETSHFPPPNGGRTKKECSSSRLVKRRPSGSLARRLTRRLCSRKDKGVRPRLGKNV